MTNWRLIQNPPSAWATFENLSFVSGLTSNNGQTIYVSVGEEKPSGSTASGIYELSAADNFAYTFSDYTLTIVASGFHLGQDKSFSVEGPPQVPGATKVLFLKVDSLVIDNDNDAFTVAGRVRVSGVTTSSATSLKGTLTLAAGASLQGTVITGVIDYEHDNAFLGRIQTQGNVSFWGNPTTLTNLIFNAAGNVSFSGTTNLNGVTLNASGSGSYISFSGTANLDGVTLNATGTGGSVTLTGPSGQTTLTNVTLTAAGKTVYNKSGATLTVASGNYTMGTFQNDTGDSGGATLRINGGQFEATTKVTNKSNASIIVNGGKLVTATFENYDASSTIEVSNSGTFSVSSTLQNSGSITVNSSTVSAATVTTSTDGTKFTVEGTSKLNITTSLSGTINLLNDAEIQDSSIASGGTLNVAADNGVTFSTTGSNTNSFSNTAVTNNGTLTVDGTMSSGTVTNNANATITVNGTMTSHAITNNANATITVEANKTLKVNGKITNNGLLKVNGAVAPDGNNALTLDNEAGAVIMVNAGGSFTANGEIKNYSSGGATTEGITIAAGGSFSTTGKLTNEADSTIEVSGNLTASGVFENSAVGTGTKGGTITVKTGGSITANAAVTNDAGATLSVSGSFTATSTSQTLTNAADAAITVNAGGSFTSKGSLSNTGTITLTGENENAAAFISEKTVTNSAGGIITVNACGSFEAWTNTINQGTITVNGAYSTTSTFTNNASALITVDAGGSFSATSFANKSGATFKIASLNDVTFSVNSFDNQSGGTIEIDVSDFLSSGAVSWTVTGLKLKNKTNNGNIVLKNGDGTNADDVKYEINDNGEIVLGLDRGCIFVNARWAGDADHDPGVYDIINDTDGYGETDYTSTLTSITYNNKSYTLEYGVNAFGSVQEAVDHAHPDGGTTIVFYNLSKYNSGKTDKDTMMADYQFYPQGPVIVDRNVAFQTGTKEKTDTSSYTEKTVKLDTLIVKDGFTATVKCGVYSLEDTLVNNGTLVIRDEARFNANLVDNAGGTIDIDMISRLVGGTIDDGTVNIRARYTSSQKFKWIYRPLAIDVGNNAVVNFVSDSTGTVALNRDGEGQPCAFKNIYVITKASDEKPLAYYVGTPPSSQDVGSNHLHTLYVTNEYSSLFLIDDTFDLKQIGETDKYATSAIYLDDDWKTTTTDTLTVDGQDKSVSPVTIDAKVGQVELQMNLSAEDIASLQPWITNPDEKYKPDDQNLKSELKSVTYTITFTAKDGSGTAVVTKSMSTTQGPELFYLTLSSKDLKPGKEYTAAITNVAYTWNNKNQSNLKSPTNEANVVDAFEYYSGDSVTAHNASSLVAAMNSDYVSDHNPSSKTSQGMVIRVREGNYDESTATSPAILSATRDLIIEPDKYQDANGEWQYDDVNMTLGNFNTSSANLLTFYKLKSLSVGDWQLGSSSGKVSVANFVKLDEFRIRTRLKALGGATLRIVGSKVYLQDGAHLSVTGGTLIIDGSEVHCVDAGTTNGVLSTQNNTVGSGSVIIRNSIFKVDNTSATDKYHMVNLKLDAEFVITGKSVVNAIFSDLTGTGSDTRITIRDAQLDENTSIRSGTYECGALIHFDGNNVLDGSFIEQKGQKGMILDADSTLDLTNGAIINLPGAGSTVTNEGIISLDGDSTISSGAFVNETNSSLTVEAGSLIQTNSFTNNEGATVTLTLTSDAAGNVVIPIQNSSGITAPIANEGTIILDASQLDYTGDGSGSGEVDVITITGDGEVILKTNAGGEQIGHVDDGNNHTYYITMKAPDTTTLYVNGEWDINESWAKGKNVGSYSYYGWNAFKDNPNSGYQYLTFTEKSTKVVYYGGNGTAYGDLDLSTAANAPDELALTSLVSMSKSKLTFNVSNTTGSPRAVSVVVKDAAGKTIEKQSILVNDGATSASIFSSKLDPEQAANYYKVYLDNAASPLASYVLAPLPEDRDTAKLSTLTVGPTQTITLSGATMGFVEESETAITINGNNTDKGTLRVAPGETAKLVLDVAEGALARDVQVKVFYSSDEWEIFTCRVQPGENQVEVASKAFALGKNYEVQVSDQGIYTAQYVSAQNSEEAARQLSVSVAVRDDYGRTVDVTVRGVDSANANTTFTFKKQSIDSSQNELVLVPAFTTGDYYADKLTIVTGTGKAEASNVKFSYIGDDLGLNLTIVKATGADAATVAPALSGNNTDGWMLTLNTVDYAKSFELTASDVTINTVQSLTYAKTVTPGAGSNSYTSTIVLPTAFIENTKYSVLVSEPEITTIAVAGPISDSYITAKDVSNSGTLIVAPENEQATISVQWTGDDAVSARTVEVTVTEGETAVGTYSVEVGTGATVASITSCEFRAGKNYSVSVKGKEYFNSNTDPDDLDAQTLTVTWTDGTAGTKGDRTVEMVVMDGTSTVGRYLVDVAAGATVGTITSAKFEQGKTYTVSIMESKTFAGTVTDTAPATNRKVARLNLTDITAEDANRKLEVSIREAGSTADPKVYSVLVEKGSTEATLVSEDFLVGHVYTATIEGENQSRNYTAQTLSYFTAEDVTNENTGVITVTDAVFEAASVVNNGSFAVSGYSKLKIGNADDNNRLTGNAINVASGATLNDSVIYGDGSTDPVDITCVGALSFAGTSALYGVTLTANTSVTNQGSLTVASSSVIRTETVTNNTSGVAEAPNTLSVTESTFEATSVTNYDTITLTEHAQFTTGTLTNESGATMTVTCSEFTATATTGTAVTNGGSLTATGSEFTVGDTTEENNITTFTGGTVTNNGTMTLDSSSIFKAGSVTNNNTLTVTASEFTVGTTTTNENVTTLSSGGVVTNNGTMTVESGSTFKAGAVVNNASGDTEAHNTLSVTDYSAFEATSVTNYDALTVTESLFTTETLTNESGATFTVAGKSTLTIGTLNGTIDLLNMATVSNSTVSAVGQNGGTVSVADSTASVAFSGTNSIASTITNNGSITVNGTLTSGAITNNGTITINAASNISAASISGGTINFINTTEITAGDVRTIDVGSKTLVSVTSGSLRDQTNGVTLTVNGDTAHPVDVYYKGIEIAGGTYTLVKSDTSIYLTQQNQETLYVNEAWKTAKKGDLVTYNDGTNTYTYIYGYNAFSSFVDALKIAQPLVPVAPNTKTTICVTSSTETFQEMLFYGLDESKTRFQGSVEIVKDGTQAVTVTIPFADGDNGLMLTPYDGKDIKIGSGVTLKSTAVGTDVCCGDFYLNYYKTTGTVTVDGTIDSAREIKIYGQTDVSKTGSLKAGTLL